jgi:hypothetical protein
MPLPDFNSYGDLPEGLHQATIDEVIERFGAGTRRAIITQRLVRIYRRAEATSKLERLIIFGSYITAKPEPNDVDVILIMRDDFRLDACDEETRKLFDHTQAAQEFGGSIFWIRPSMLILETLDEFVRHWQIKRDRTRRGIVEVRI